MTQPCIVLAHPVRHPEPVTVTADQVAATVAAWFDPPPPGADPEDERRFARVSLVCQDLQAACRPGSKAGAVITPCRALGVFVCAAAPPGVVEPGDPWSASHPSEGRARAWVLQRVERHRAAVARQAAPACARSARTATARGLARAPHLTAGYYYEP